MSCLSNYGIKPSISNQTVAAKILRKCLWGNFLRLLDFLYVVSFLFLPCSLLLCDFGEQDNTSVDMFQTSEQVSSQGSSCLSTHSSAFMSSDLSLHDNCMSLLLCISCHESALLLFIISVTVRKLDGSHLFRSSLSLSQYWTWQINEDLCSRKFAEGQRKREAMQGDDFHGFTG